MQVKGAKFYFAAAFLNAFVDLGHKITIQNAIFKNYDGTTQVVLTAFVNGLILLPFIFLFLPAGRITDRYPRDRVMQISAWATVALALGIAIFYHMGWFEAAFAMTFMLAAQSAIYSPAKFAYLKGLFGAENLARANGITQAIAIVAILGGTMSFSILFESLFNDAQTTGETLQQVAGIGWLLVAGALIEVVCLYRLPRSVAAPQTSPSLAAGSMIRRVMRRRVMSRTILGISLFWGIGQVMVATFPAFVKVRTGIDSAAVVQAVLAMSGVGIAFGALVAGRLSRNYIETGLIPVGAIGIGLALWAIPFADGIVAFGLLNFGLGFAGGLFVIPLNALLQFHGDERELGSVISVRNLFSNLCMLAFLAATILLSAVGVSEAGLLVALALIAVVGVIYTISQVPYSLTRFLVAGLMSQRYRLRVQGMENIPGKGGVLLLGNHISWIDWAMLQMASPRQIRFVMAHRYYNHWYLRWALDAVGCIPITGGGASKQALERVADALTAGDAVCLFPEGALTVNGQLGEFKRGYETALRLSGKEIPIVPFHIHGLWGDRLSMSSEGFKTARAASGRRNVVITFGALLPRETSAVQLKQKIVELSVAAWQEYAESLPAVGAAYVAQCKQMGSRTQLHDDISGNLSARRALTGAVLISRRITHLWPGQQVGLMLPFSAGGVLANMATLLAGKTLVNLNYTASADALRYACEASEIKRVLTARRFTEQLQKRGIALEALLPDVEFIYLEDLRKGFSRAESLVTLLMITALPTPLLTALICRHPDPERAAIIFSSGSEGVPKGVILSHTNLMANVKQIADALQPDTDDVMMGSLPLFHAFGLTAAQLMPLIEGVPLICQPDPTDVESVAKGVARYRATIMFGTSTFLRFYCRNRKVEPLMLASLRLVVAGAEKLAVDVREDFERKFRKPIYEGYGMTEAAPVVSVNLPDSLDTNSWRLHRCNKLGTVGQPIPGTSIRIADPATYASLPIGEEGMVLVGGPQVMKGYLDNPAKSSQVLIQQDGIVWYVSGDKGRLDEDGFLTLIDRYSRMAKLGGEMVSLSAVEQMIRPGLIEQQYEGDLIATSIADARKGERLVVLLDADFDLKAMQEYLKNTKANPLMRPSSWLRVDSLPRLGAGKCDYSGAKQLAIQLEGNAAIQTNR